MHCLPHGIGRGLAGASRSGSARTISLYGSRAIRDHRGTVHHAANLRATEPAFASPSVGDEVRLLTGLSDEALMFLWAKKQSKSAKRQIAAYLMTYREVRPSLTGKDLKALGQKPGPRYRPRS